MSRLDKLEKQIHEISLMQKKMLGDLNKVDINTLQRGIEVIKRKIRDIKEPKYNKMIYVPLGDKVIQLEDNYILQFLDGMSGDFTVKYPVNAVEGMELTFIFNNYNCTTLKFEDGQTLTLQPNSLCKINLFYFRDTWCISSTFYKRNTMKDVLIYLNTATQIISNNISYIPDMSGNKKHITCSFRLGSSCVTNLVDGKDRGIFILCFEASTNVTLNTFNATKGFTLGFSAYIREGGDHYLSWGDKDASFISLDIGDTNTTSAIVVKSATKELKVTNITLKAFHQFYITHDPTSKKVNIYVDGVSVAEDTFEDLNITNTLLFGNTFGNENKDPVMAFMRRFIIYNRPLTKEEILKSEL